MITDFHTHAFPDALAERAMTALLAETEDVTAHHDGRLSSLLASMDRAGIDRSVLCSIATRPEQFEKILAWSLDIASDRVVPFASVHPSDPELEKHLHDIADAGLSGIKLHPYYQDFYLDEERVAPLYRTLCETGLLLVCHTGFDVAFPRVRRCDPVRIARVVDRYPKLKIVTTHLGSWSDWDEVRTHIMGRPIFMEISYAFPVLAPGHIRDILLSHPRDYLLFGTDSPWQDQTEALDMFRMLGLGSDLEHAMLETNAERLLGK